MKSGFRKSKPAHELLLQNRRGLYMMSVGCLAHPAVTAASVNPYWTCAVPVSGLVGGIGGAFGGDALGKWIVDITCEEDWTWG